ncbi:MAG: TonB-dependent receptor [Acidobacteriia bacterium]|nr:TonB-dependent receptor [Terriglobia bacterium]
MRKEMRFGVFTFLCFCLFLLPTTALAQVKATIVGTVTDPSGAVMPGVKITVTNTDTSVARALETNAAGNYLAPELVPGPYEVKAEAKGFRAYSRSGIVLNVNDTLRVDIQMQVGEITQSVTVSEAVVKVQTESGEVGDTVSGTQLTTLPVNTRSFFVLATLTTGVSSNMPDFTLPIPVGGDSSIRFNGNRNDHNIWMIDGGEDYDRGCGGCVTVMPSMDALQEFKVMTSNYGADFGIGSGGTVNMMLKSGTRSFHGSAYEFVRNDVLDAVNYLTNAVPRKADGTRASAAPIMRFNNFGWNLGGPFYIPGKYNTQKNKTFFFFNQEWRRIRLGQVRSANAVPQAERLGDFSGSPITIMVPTAAAVGDPAFLAKLTAAGLTPGQAFPNKAIPDSLIDPNAKLFFGSGAFPLPTSGGTFTGSRMTPTNVREEIIRVDHNFSDKLSVMAHFINDAVLQQTDETLWAGMSYPTLGTSFLNPGKHAVIRLTYTISPTLLNEFAYNYNGNRIWLSPVGVFAKPSGMNLKEFFSGNSDSRIPVIQFQKETGANYDSGSWPWHNAADSQQVRDDVSKMAGKHALKFGGQFMRYRKNQDIFGQTQGGYTFNGRFTGSDVADFLLGLANSYHELAIQDRGHWRTSTFSFYFTDSWRASKRLTLNLGARWEIMPHVYEIANRQSNFYPTLYNPAEAPIFNADGSLDTTGPGFTTVSGVPLSTIPFYMNGVGLAGKGVPRGLVDNHFNTIGPRVGFAYDLTGNGKTVVRGGFGMFYERIQGNDVYNGGPNPPFSFDPNVSLVYFTDPSVSVLNGAKAAVPIFPGAFAQALDKAYLPPTSQQWSFGLQRELMPRTVLSVGYVGNGNYHQSINRNINMPFPNDPRRADVQAGKIGVNLIRPYPGFSALNYAENSTSGNYHSLQVNLRTDNYHGFTFQGAYTWSKTIDLTSGDNAQFAFDPYDLAKNRGPADWDIRQIMIMNYIYDLPFWRHSSNAFVRHGLGGWQLSGITMFQTGPPVTVTYPGDNVGAGVGNERTDLTGDPNSGPKNMSTWFNTDAFAAPAVLTWGTEGRNVVRRAGRNNWNISLAKAFSGIPIGTKEGASFQFRADFFNAFNHNQPQNLDTNFSSGTFGRVTSTWDARRVQLGLKFIF